MRKIIKSAVFTCALAGMSTLGCSTAVEPPPEGFGTLRLNLATTVEDTAYELRSATFHVDGETSLTLEETGDAPVSLLEREVPAGEYTIKLDEGWSLFEMHDAAFEPVEATLVSPNPASFTVFPETLTEVNFRFQTSSKTSSAAGTFQIGIDVEELPELSVIFSEFMPDPASVPDAEGEWFEVFNAGADPVDLQGCSIARDDTEVVIDASLVLAPGQRATFANGESPGFEPDFVYSRITLPNSSVFTLKLACGAQLLDEITVDPAAWPGGAGVSTSLSGNVSTSGGNDAQASWCAATESFGSDLGTPGTENPVC